MGWWFQLPAWPRCTPPPIHWSWTRLYLAALGTPGSRNRRRATAVDG